MMKVLSAIQIREADDFTIANEPIDSFSLMKRASQKCTEWILNNIDSDERFTVFCGTGNNGGDGLCISRMLKAAGRNVEVFLLTGQSKPDDFVKALKAAQEAGIVSREFDQKKCISFNSDSVLVDAIFGTGINRPVEGWIAKCIEAINESGCTIISIDVPSGLMTDEPTKGAIIKATYTLTFQFPKYAFFFADSGNYVGDFQVLDIGLSEEYIENVKGVAEYVTPAFIKDLLRPRSKFSHKGDFGKSLLIAGSRGKMGAAVLAARSCLRTGAGLLTVHVPGCGYDIIQTSIPEAMCEIDTNDEYNTSLEDLSKYNAIGAGPGIGTSEGTSKMLLALLKQKQPMVLDADALNIISENKSALKNLHSSCILTPHPGEFDRLAGKSADSFQRHKRQREFCDEYNVVVVLKGAYTCITIPGGKTYFNSTGNPGMAKGGSGDALTGMLLGLLSQGYPAHEAAVLGVYLHGLAGDLASISKGEHSMLCSDLIEHIADAYKVIST